MEALLVQKWGPAAGGTLRRRNQTPPKGWYSVCSATSMAQALEWLSPTGAGIEAHTGLIVALNFKRVIIKSNLLWVSAHCLAASLLTTYLTEVLQWCEITSDFCNWLQYTHTCSRKHDSNNEKQLCCILPFCRNDTFSAFFEQSEQNVIFSCITVMIRTMVEFCGKAGCPQRPLRYSRLLLTQ